MLTKNIHFFPSQVHIHLLKNPASDPDSRVIYLRGPPVCSSVGSGEFEALDVKFKLEIVGILNARFKYASRRGGAATRTRPYFPRAIRRSAQGWVLYFSRIARRSKRFH